MRIFSFIFVFYLLLLSWQPCQDLAAKDFSCSPSDAHQSHLHDTEQPEEGDDCSPFCVCSCCQTSVTHANVTFSVGVIFAISAEKDGKIPYQSDYFQQHSNSIWQPPKFNFTA